MQSGTTNIKQGKGFTQGPSAAYNQVASEQTAKKPGYWLQTMPIAPLIVFRIVFALMLLAGTIRFWAKGWIEELYIRPGFFFSYYGFEWVKPAGIYIFLLWF
jgi:hypothetical protein